MAIKLIMPFVDPVTKSKVSFNQDPVKMGVFTPENVLSSIGWGGSADFEYDHEKYWPSFVKMCRDRRKQNLERWRVLGGKLGISEADYKKEGAVGEVLKVVEDPLPVTQTEENKAAES